VPTLRPFTCHWKVGLEPWLLGRARKVTLSPAQMVVSVAWMLMLTGTLGATVMVMVLEVAGLPVTHGALEVMTQVIWSPFTRVLFT
jgi:hypothetical protein